MKTLTIIFVTLLLATMVVRISSIHNQVLDIITNPDNLCIEGDSEEVFVCLGQDQADKIINLLK